MQSFPSIENIERIAELLDMMQDRFVWSECSELIKNWFIAGTEWVINNVVGESNEIGGGKQC